MHFRPEFIEEFKAIFLAARPLILASEGCNGVELLQHERDQTIFFTISKWDSAAHLENYRHSELFHNTWAKVKPHFYCKAEAWSLMES